MNGPALSIAALEATAPDFGDRLDALVHRVGGGGDAIDATVRGIIDRVRGEGDAALIELTERFDGFRPAVSDFEVDRVALERARESLAPALRRALEDAAARIRRFHEHEALRDWSFEEADGTVLGQKVTALARVGVYVPGGKAAYPSSVLMNVIPARVAGVDEVVMVAPAPGGVDNDAVHAAAAIAGADRVFRIGGAQAVAALAYGTATVPRVDKIVGPGNRYVAAAKRLLFGVVGIDMIAGPSEVVVICDGGADPEWVAMDLFAQAEHDESAQSILICPERAQIDRVRDAIGRLLPGMERASIIAASLAAHGATIHCRDLEQALAIANRIAPEHLELMVADPQPLIALVRHAGAVFAGYRSAEALGDYCAGPNHVLPTGGTARFSSPLGVHDFQKRTSLIVPSARGAADMAATAETLARAEGLTAHARAAAMRRG